MPAATGHTFNDTQRPDVTLESFHPDHAPPRPSPLHWLVRVKNRPNTGQADVIVVTGQCVWATGDLDEAERRGEIDILQRPLIEGPEADVWDRHQQHVARMDRMRRAGIALPETPDDVDDWANDKGMFR